MPGVNTAIDIWRGGVDAVNPRKLVGAAIGGLANKMYDDRYDGTERIIVVGAGKAAAPMAAEIEAYQWRNNRIDLLDGIVNVPEGAIASLERIRLNAARPAGSNHPTEAGVVGAEEMLKMLSEARPQDYAFCLLSGGGSALLPAPVAGVSLAEKQAVTRLLHACGATINEMNCVRKHISRVKGGRLAEAFHGRMLISLIISDVLNDPLDVIASGPTAPDPTTFADAIAVIDKYALRSATPKSIISYLEAGVRGERPETPKSLPDSICNTIIGSNTTAIEGSEWLAGWYFNDTTRFDFFLQGEARDAAVRMSGIVRDHRRHSCILFGGETTVTLGPNPGKGGRNQEFVLTMLCELGLDGMKGVTILSGGTDGEDGPTDAAGAIGTEETLLRAKALNLNPKDFLNRHDAYHFFEATGGLFKTGLTGTNVMDLGVILLN